MKARHGLIAAATLLAGCGPGAPSRSDASTPSASGAAEAGFDGPPRAALLTGLAGGGAVLSGAAAPEAEVRLATPQGRAFTATADDAGAWRLQLPRLDEATLFGLSSRRETRTVQAEGYVAVLPAPAPFAVLLRAGASASPIRPAAPALAVEAVDVDAAGAAVVSGSGPAGAALAAFVDGAAAGEGAANDAGRFIIPLTRPLAGGGHQLAVRQATSGAESAVRVVDARPMAPEAGPYSARRLEGAWRLDWLTPGGGLQTTLLFDRAGAGA